MCQELCPHNYSTALYWASATSPGYYKGWISSRITNIAWGTLITGAFEIPEQVSIVLSWMFKIVCYFWSSALFLSQRHWSHCVAIYQLSKVPLALSLSEPKQDRFQGWRIKEGAREDLLYTVHRIKFFQEQSESKTVNKGIVNEPGFLKDTREWCSEISTRMPLLKGHLYCY